MTHLNTFIAICGVLATVAALLAWVLSRRIGMYDKGDDE